MQITGERNSAIMADSADLGNLWSKIWREIEKGVSIFEEDDEKFAFFGVKNSFSHPKFPLNSISFFPFTPLLLD